MGFTVYYRSTTPVARNGVERIIQAVGETIRGRSWLSCEPVAFFGADEDGHLSGGSKPNFMPHPDDAASAKREGLPDGTIHDVIEILCDISKSYGVDWEIGQDDYDGPVGFIRNGVADPAVLRQIEGFMDLCDALSDFGPWSAEDDSSRDDGEDGPPIIRLWPGGD